MWKKWWICPTWRNEGRPASAERAKAVRQESRQKGQKPDWGGSPVGKISHPLAEVRNRITEELARRQSQDALVPIDRDPVPNKFSELVRQLL